MSDSDFTHCKRCGAELDDVSQEFFAKVDDPDTLCMDCVNKELEERFPNGPAQMFEAMKW